MRDEPAAYQDGPQDDLHEIAARVGRLVAAIDRLVDLGILDLASREALIDIARGDDES